jgi:integrase
LRIVSAEEDLGEEPSESAVQAPPLSGAGDWTLWEFWRRWVLPQRMTATAEPTRREYEYFLRPGGPWFWCTGDPPLGTIRGETLTHFFRVVRGWPGRKPGSRASADTLKKFARMLQRLLLLAAPRAQCERAATKRGLFGADEDGDPIYAPRLSALKVLGPPPRRPPNPFRVSELGQVLSYLESDRARVEVTQPRVPGVEPREWWRSLVIFAFETGARRGALLAIEYGMVSRLDDGLVVLTEPPEIAKGLRGQTIVLSPEAQEAIDRIRTPRPKIFPWTCCQRYFDSVRQKILAAAGLPADRQLTLHAVRKSLATELGKVNVGAAVLQAGHSAEVAARHYQGLALIDECSRKMARPRRAAAAAKPDPQQRELPF